MPHTGTVLVSFISVCAMSRRFYGFEILNGNKNTRLLIESLVLHVMLDCDVMSLNMSLIGGFFVLLDVVSPFP